jgi:hypothetical protein
LQTSTCVLITDAELVMVEVCFGSGLQFRMGARAPIFAGVSGASSQASPSLEVTVDSVDDAGRKWTELLVETLVWGFCEFGVLTGGAGFSIDTTALDTAGFLVVFGLAGLGLLAFRAWMGLTSSNDEPGSKAARSSRVESPQPMWLSPRSKL